MVKVRLITLVAVLCLAQLAVTATRQLQDSGSDLNSLRGTVGAFIERVRVIFANGSATTIHPKVSKPQATAKAASARSGELAAPSIANEADITFDNSSKAPGAAVTGRNEERADKKKSASARDPFVPFFSIRNKARNDSSSSLTEYDLTELRVAAIVSDALGNRSASVEATDGKSFIVRVGTKIGANGGRIETITPTSIVISEPGDSTFGNQGTATKELSLKTHPPTSFGAR